MKSLTQLIWVSLDDALPLKEGSYTVMTDYSKKEEKRYFDGKQFSNYDGYKVIKWMLPSEEIEVVEEEKKDDYMNIVIWYDKSYKIVEGATWEYENDENWFMTIPLFRPKL